MKRMLLLPLALLLCAVTSLPADDDQAKLKAKKNGAGANTDLQVNALLQRLDTNKDGKISRSEAEGRPLARAFDSLDANKDGYLDRTELLVWVQRIGKAGANKGPKAQKAAEEVIKSTSYDFDALDKDADGRLSFEELRGTSWPEVFNKVDANKDGKIDKKEFEAYVRRLEEANKPESTKDDKSKKK